MKFETTPARLARLAARKKRANLKFRSFLKFCDLPGKQIDSTVHALAKSISAQIDCTQCANCCKVSGPVLQPADITRLAAHLRLSDGELQSKYLKKDEDGDWIFKALPCPFLKDNRCTVYVARPHDCQSFPHLHKPEFTTRLLSVCGNCAVCPIVYNVYEALKAELWHREDDPFGTDDGLI